MAAAWSAVVSEESPTWSRTASSGVLVPPGDAGALADALVRVLGDTALAADLGACSTGGGGAVAGRARRSTPVACVSSWTRSRVAREARLRDPGGRPGEPGARCHRGEDRRARGPRRRGRGARRPGRRRGARPPTAAFAGSAPRRGPGGECASRRRSRASWRGRRGRQPSSPTCARSTPCSRLRWHDRSESACCSGSPTGARVGCLQAAERAATDVITVERRSFPLDSGKVTAIGHGIDLTEFACVERTAFREPRAALARADVACQGPRDRDPRRGAGSGGATLPGRPVTHRRGAIAPVPARAPRRRPGRRRQGRDRPARPTARGRSVAGLGRRPGQQHAGRRDRQGGLRGSGDVPARARLQPCARRVPAREHAVPARRRRCPRRENPIALRRSTVRRWDGSCEPASSEATRSKAGPTASSRSLPGERLRSSCTSAR